MINLIQINNKMTDLIQIPVINFNILQKLQDNLQDSLDNNLLNII